MGLGGTTGVLKRGTRRLSATVLLCLLLGAASLGWASRGEGAHPGANGMIAYTVARPAGFGSVDRELYTVNADGSGSAFRLDEALGQEWSPDGNKLLFLRVSPGVSDLYVMNVDGTGERKLTSGIFAHSPTWSPDGSKIAYLHASPSNSADSEVWTMNADGTGKTQVTTDGFAKLNLDWALTPIGSRLAYAGVAPVAGWSLVTMNPDGTGRTPLSGISQDLAQRAGSGKLDWSPDGTKILFGSYTGLATGCGGINIQAYDVYVYAMATATLTNLTNTPSWEGPHEQNPAWSPDGTRIVMEVNHRTCQGDVPGFVRPAIHTMAATGGATFKITSPAVNGDVYDSHLQPQWQPCVGVGTAVCKSVAPPPPPQPPQPPPGQPPVTPPGPAPGDTPGVALDTWPGFRLQLTPGPACAGGICTSVRQRVANGNRYSRRTFSQVYATLNDGRMETQGCAVSDDEVGFPLLLRLCFPKSESTWLSQGLAGSHERRTADSPGGTWLVVSWCHRGTAKSCSKATETKTRVTLVGLSGAGAKRFEHVLLTEPFCSGGDATCTLKALRAHAGGAAVAGKWLYVADTNRVLVFDLSFFLVDRQDEPFLPLDHSFEVRNVGGPAGATTTRTGQYLSSLSIDANGSLVVAQYLDTKHDALVARFPLTSNGRLAVTGGRVHSTAVYTIDKDSDIDKVQGVASAGGTLLFSTSGAKLERARPNTVRQKDDKRIAWGQNQAQDLYASPATGRLWGINEYPGDRTIWSVNHRQAFGPTTTRRTQMQTGP